MKTDMLMAEEFLEDLAKRAIAEEEIWYQRFRIFTQLAERVSESRFEMEEAKIQ